MKRTHVLLWAIAILVGIVIVARAARKGSTSSVQKTHGALERNYVFAGRVLSGQDPYSKPQIHAPYPPSYGIVMAPLRTLPLLGARIAWAMLQVLMLFLLVRHLWTWAKASDGTRAPPLWAMIAALALVLRYLSRDTSGGGGNLVWGSFVFLAILRPTEAPGVDRQPGRGVLLGIVLGAKPTPLLFLPWLWWRGRRRTLGVACATAGILHLSPILTLGVSGWLEAYATWANGVWTYTSQSDLFATPAHDFPPFTWMHQSLRWALTRFLGTVPPEHALDSALFFQGLGLSPTWITTARRVAEATIAAITLVVLYRARRAADPRIEALACGALACATLLLSPIVWKSYHLWLLPLFFALLVSIARREGGPRREILIGSILYFALCGLSSQLLLGDQGKEVMQSLYVVTLGALWLWQLALRELLRVSNVRQRRS